MNLSLLGLSGGMIALFVILAFIVLFVTKPLSFFWTYGNDAKEWAELFDEALAEQDQIELQKEQCVEALASVRAEEAMLEEQLETYAKKRQEREIYRKKQQDVLRELYAIEAATEALRLAGIQVQQEKRVQLNRTFSSYLQTFTNGSHTQAHVNEQAQWKIFSGEQYRDSKALSSGTAEQLALSFKFAAEELFAEGKRVRKHTRKNRKRLP